MSVPRRLLRLLLAAGCAAAVLGQAAPAHAAAWRATGQMATARGEHTAIPLASGRVLVAGGRTGATTSTSSAEVYDPVSESWGAGGSMTVARSFHTATRLPDGRVLVAGGLGDTSPTPTAELFNPLAAPASAWTAAPSLAGARSQHAAAALADGRVLVTGGLGADGAPTTSVEIFDPAANGGAGAWIAGPSLALARARHTATTLRDGRVLVIGGTTCASPPPAACPAATVELFDPAANAGAGGWSSAPDGGLRLDHVAIRLAGGDVLAVGGMDGLGSMRQSAQVFHADAAGGVTWTEGNPMRVARTNFAAALLPDGRVLATGGGTGNSIDEESSEIWNPADRTWTGTAAIATARRAHALTALTGPGCAPNCGKLLVVGGVRNVPGDYLRSAELYDENPAATSHPPPPAPATPPGAVRDLTARALSTSRIELVFSAPGSPPARNYVVKQSRSRITGAEAFSRARSLCGGTCRFGPRRAGERLTLSVGGLRPKTAYHYALRAIGADGRLYPISNVASARTRSRRPGRVRGLRVRALSPTRLRVRFRATGAPPARRYVVKQSGSRIRSARAFRRARSLCGGLCRFRVRTEGRPVELLVTRLRPATRYCYAVSARHGRRLTPRSRSVCARTRHAR